MDDPCVLCVFFFFFNNFFWERLSYFFFFFFRATEIWGGRSQDKRNGITINKKIDFYFSGKHFTKEN